MAARSSTATTTPTLASTTANLTAHLNIINVTGSFHSRIIQCLTTTKAGLSFDEEVAKVQDAEDRPPRDDRQEPRRAETPAALSSADNGGSLSTIPEGDEDADLILEERARELEAYLNQYRTKRICALCMSI